LGSDAPADIAKQVLSWRWKGTILRRQRLSQDDLKHVANTIAKRLVKLGTQKTPANQTTIKKPQSDWSYSPEQRSRILGLLKESRWNAYTYTEISSSTGIPWRSTLGCLNTLRQEKLVRAIGPEGRPEGFVYCPEYFTWATFSKKDTGRLAVVARLVYQFVRGADGTSKRSARRAIRIALGSVADATVDRAIDVLSDHQAISRTTNEQGLCASYTACQNLTAAQTSDIKQKCATVELAARKARCRAA